jgi:isopenicillin-N epimerase
MIDRREFVAGSSLMVGNAALNSVSRIIPEAPPPEADRYDWEAVRSQFNVDRDFIHMAALFLASHPKPVRDAIEMHRRGLDASPLNLYKY